MLLARRGRQAACALFQPVCSSSWMSIHTSTECMAPAGRGRGGGIPSRFSTPGGGDGKDVGKDDSVTRLEDAQFRDAASTTPLADEVDRRDADHQRRKSMLGVSRERREQMAHREHPHRKPHSLRTTHEDIEIPKVEHNRTIVAIDTTDLDAAAMSDAEQHDATNDDSTPSATAEQRPGRAAQHRKYKARAPQRLVGNEPTGDDEEDENEDDDHLDITAASAPSAPWEWAPEDKQRLVQLGMEHLPSIQVAPMMLPQNKEDLKRMRREVAYEWYRTRRPGLIPFEHQPKPVFSDSAKERAQEEREYEQTKELAEDLALNNAAMDLFLDIGDSILDAADPNKIILRPGEWMYPEFRLPYDPIEYMENNRAVLRQQFNIHSEAKWQALKDVVEHNWPHIKRFTEFEDVDAMRRALFNIAAEVPPDHPMHQTPKMYAEVLDANPNVSQVDKLEFMRRVVQRVLEPDTEEYEELSEGEDDGPDVRSLRTSGF